VTRIEPRPDANAGGEGEPGGNMTLVEHLEELRSRLFKAALAIAIAFVVGFMFRNLLFEILIQPYCDLPAAARAASETFDAGECALIVTSPLGEFFVTIKAAAVLAVVLGAPPVCYQLWRFLTFVLFAAGGVFAYMVIPRGLEFLVGFAGDNVVSLFDADEYITFLLKTMLGFGLSFLAPLVIAMLTLAGAVTAESLRRYRRHAIFGAFVLAAIITPTQDPFTMLVMALPLVLFFEGNIIFARLVERRRRASLA
jgi:sec-independent protein translocase protein TatC